MGEKAVATAAGRERKEFLTSGPDFIQQKR
jgi:hypothetical protein